jgi:hypothetical protein
MVMLPIRARSTKGHTDSAMEGMEYMERTGVSFYRVTIVINFISDRGSMFALLFEWMSNKKIKKPLWFFCFFVFRRFVIFYCFVGL